MISPPPIVASPENLTQPTNIPQVIPATPIPTDNNTGQPIPQSNETTPPPPPPPTTTPPTTPPTTIINNTATAIAISNTVYNIKVENTVRQVVAGSVQSAGHWTAAFVSNAIRHRSNLSDCWRYCVCITATKFQS